MPRRLVKAENQAALYLQAQGPVPARAMAATVDEASEALAALPQVLVAMLPVAKYRAEASAAVALARWVVALAP